MENYGPDLEPSATAGRCPRCRLPLDDHRFQQVLIVPGKYVATTDAAFDCEGAKEKKEPGPPYNPLGDDA